jgi:hypothetical protein
MTRKNKVQGEGNYEAAEEYNEGQRRFVKSGKVKPAAENARPKNKDEASSMERAESVGRSRAKGEDPALRSKKPVKAKA